MAFIFRQQFNLCQGIGPISAHFAVALPPVVAVLGCEATLNLSGFG